MITKLEGGDIKEAFEKMCAISSHLQKTCKFAYDYHLGYITANPAMLGTAMKASYHVYLPKVRKATIDKIAAKFNLIVSKAVWKGTWTSNENMFHICNSKVLGRSEILILKDLYDGVKAMV